MAQGDGIGHETKGDPEPAARHAVAAAAAGLVRPGSVVAVSGGATAHAVAAALRRTPGLTVVTNSLPVAGLLRHVAEEAGPDAGAPTVLLTGGAPTRSASLVGPLADQAIRSLRVDLLLMGAHGVSERAGLTSPNLAEAGTNRALIESANRLAVVADHTAWGVVGMSRFAGLDEIDYFVTDDALAEEARSVLNGQVGRLILAGTTPA
ncbi:DeoR/GlpR family DNA-binding transcription regulator [Streptomyces sp. NPDC085466]|uniref:DeoR/GlpR family DNA-binding transcription regulator n=1 Tax=Streptomyces sp. NPDC085466 TaxID=3365725 RepID=UPI0037CDD4C4